MDRIVPIIVQPKYQGNIGSIARLCRNFGVRELILVDPPPLEDEAWAYSMHGREVLERAVIVDSLEEASGMVDHLVGTSGVSESTEKNYHRNPVYPREFISWSRDASGRIGLAFGREDFGLFRTELDICDLLVTIPASPAYPILNLSHAVSIILYELFNAAEEPPRRNARPATGTEKEALFAHYDRLMEACGVPEHKRPIARTNFRRMVSRSNMNYREFYSLMGTFSRAMVRIGRSATGDDAEFGTLG